MLKSSSKNNPKLSAPAAQEESDTMTLREMIEEIINGEEDDQTTELDLQATINLNDRLDSIPKDRQEALSILEEIFKTGPSESILRSVKLLELIVKNCNHGFFKDLAQKQFQDSILKLLDRKRGKKSFFKSIKQNTKNWDEIEKKVLYLIQLWYDTFMMHEADFPHIMNNYKLLRKEGMKFPERSVNEIHMINFKGIKSPILQILEEKQMQQSDHTVSSKKDQHGNLPEISIKQARAFSMTQENIDQVTDNVLMLTAIVESAQFVDDLQTEYALEMLQTLMTFIAKIDLMSQEGALNDLKSSRDDIVGLAEQANQIVESHQAKKEDIEIIQQAIQASAIEEFSREANQAPSQQQNNQSQPIKPIEQKAPQQPIKYKEVNLLDLEDDDDFVSPINKVNNNASQQMPVDQHQVVSNIQLTQPAQIIQQQPFKQLIANEEIDLFEDFDPSSVSKVPITNKVQLQQNNQQQQKQQHQNDDFDDFLSSIVK